MSEYEVAVPLDCMVIVKVEANSFEEAADSAVTTIDTKLLSISNPKVKTSDGSNGRISRG